MFAPSTRKSQMTSSERAASLSGVWMDWERGV